MHEVELKFLMDADGLRKLRERLTVLLGRDAPYSRNTLRSIYFDTTEQQLRAEGIALRLRNTGNGWEQTVKAAFRNHGGLQSGREVTVAVPDARLDLAAIPDADLRDRIARAAGDSPLSAVFETIMDRQTALARLPGGTVEIALDAGEIRTTERAQAFHETELELKDGTVDVLFDLTSQLFPDGGVDFSRTSKAARGFRLAAGGDVVVPPAPRNARRVNLKPKQRAEDALRSVLRECFDQIAWNTEVVRRIDDPEGPHQLRIGLRRLRSAYLVFRPLLETPEVARLNREARWLAGEVGILRDLDVAQSDILAPAAAAHPNEPGFAKLSRALQDRTAAQRSILRDTLTGPRAQRFLLDLARFNETRGWRCGGGASLAKQWDRPLRDLAGSAMTQRWEKARKRAHQIETLDLEARHALRKELKKLRYTTEFLGPVLHPNRQRKFVKRLKRLQNIFGDLNDLAMAETLFLSPGAPGEGDADAQRAVGRILGSRTVLAETHWAEARDLWHDLCTVKPCW